MVRRMLWIVVTLGFVLLSPPAKATSGEDAKQFLGTWRLVSIESALTWCDTTSSPLRTG